MRILLSKAKSRTHDLTHIHRNTGKSHWPVCWSDAPNKICLNHPIIRSFGILRSAETTRGVSWLECKQLGRVSRFHHTYRSCDGSPDYSDHDVIEAE